MGKGRSRKFSESISSTQNRSRKGSAKYEIDEIMDPKILGRTILRKRKDNADLYNRYMCLKTIGYIKDSETKQCSIEGYLQMISDCKKKINEADKF